MNKNKNLIIYNMNKNKNIYLFQNHTKCIRNNNKMNYKA